MRDEQAGDDLADRLAAAGVPRGGLVALVVGPRGEAAVSAAGPAAGRALGSTGGSRGVAPEPLTWTWPDGAVAADVQRALARVEHRLRPRWLWWSAAGTAASLVTGGLRPATCWDVAAVHRLLNGGTADAPGVVWAALHGLDPADVPRTGQLDLLSNAAPAVAGPAGRTAVDPVDPDGAVDPDGHLRAEWADGGWARTAGRRGAWSRLLLTVQARQAAELADRAQVPGVTGDPVRTAHAESTAALLCVELAQDGLPLDVAEMERLVEEQVGPRPVDAAQEAALRRQRDEAVLRHTREAAGARTDLRNPGQVRTLLAKVGVDVPDTRSWRLEPWREQVPLVDALLIWRKADRIATTYGYSWLDRFVGPDHRLRGEWSASDGAAGRMTAGAGLHNLPAELRPGVAAADGHVLVRADLGQVEPRVLAAVSGDPALAAATRDDDLYAPVAARLRVERPVAKIAVLAAMYGQTSGAAGEALKGMDAAYPVAMRYLRQASDTGRAGRPVHTHGGRRVPMWATPAGLEPAAEQSVVAGRGRFARNAVVQGAAAELFKAWAVTVRAGGRALDAHVVLCLHDELLVHVPQARADDVVRLLGRALDDVGAAWAPRAGVRFVADVRVVRRWSEAKG